MCQRSFSSRVLQSGGLKSCALQAASEGDWRGAAAGWGLRSELEGCSPGPGSWEDQEQRPSLADLCWAPGWQKNRMPSPSP